MAELAQNMTVGPEVFGTLANQARLEIIFCLMDGEKCVSQICQELGIDQPMASHGLRKLESTGFVKVRKEGKFHFFSLNHEFAGPFLAALDPSRFAAGRTNLLRVILAQAPITISITDKRGVFILIFGDILRSYGAVEEDFIGKTFRDFYAGREPIIDNMDRALRGETVRWVTKAGEHVFDTMAMPYRDDSGEIAGLLNVSYELPKPSKDL